MYTNETARQLYSACTCIHAYIHVHVHVHLYGIANRTQKDTADVNARERKLTLLCLHLLYKCTLKSTLL